MQTNEHRVNKIHCRDGSDTLFSSLFGQHYHNPNGAIEESKYVFFEQSGLQSAISSSNFINILEIGFGTGLNALLLDHYIKSNPRRSNKVSYQSVEAFPISKNDFLALNYHEMLGDCTLRHAIATFFGKPMHGQNEVVDTEIIKLNVFYGLFDAMPLEPLSIKFDYVFFDAFSPEANPDLWSPAVFERILKVCAEHCILATYGAASKARAAMAVAGWKLAKCRGALGKREMTLASPSAEALQFGDLKQLSTQRLIDRWLAGEFT